MTDNAVQSTDEAALSLQNGSHAPRASEKELTPEQKDSLLAWAKDVIAGRVRPPVIIATPEIERFLVNEFLECDPSPTVKAIRHITEQLFLQSQYKGEPVACFTTAEGLLAILAVGEREIWPLIESLSDEEQSKVIIMDTL